MAECSPVLPPAGAGPRRLFPAGLPLTREAFEAWFDDVYVIALRGAFRSKLVPACGVRVGRRGGNNIVTSDPHAAQREAKRDALSNAVEMIYTARGKNPVLGRCYNSVRHLAHTFRKVADGHACGRQRVERKAARLVPDPTLSGINARTASAVPTTAEYDAPKVAFVPKYVAYEKVPCPACHRADVPLTTRRCPDCGVLIPHGARVQLRDDARERLWTRALAEVRRDFANGKEAPDEDVYPHESMLPHEITAPWTAGLQGAYRAGVVLRAERRKANEARRGIDAVLNKADDAREMEGEKPMQFDRGTRVPAWELRVDGEGATGAQPARPVHTRRHPAAPVCEPMTERQRLDRALPIWRLAVASEGELVIYHEVATRAGRVPSAYRRRRPGPDPMEWPTRPLTVSAVPKAVQRYRARTTLIGLHLIANLESVADAIDADGRAPWMPDQAETLVKSDFALAEALILTKPDFGASYDEARRARSWFLLRLAWYRASLSLDFETMGREVARLYRVEDGGRLQGDTDGKVWWTASGRIVQRWCADQRLGFRKDLRDARLRSRWEGW